MVKEIYNKVSTIQTSLDKVEKTTQAQEEKINSLITSSFKGIKPIIPQRQSVQLRPVEPPIGQIGLNMLQIKNFGRKLRQKCSKKKPKMNWNKFGENEWQIIEKATIEEKLPPDRNEDLFIFADKPVGEGYEITKWGNLETLTRIVQKFDVFHPDWIREGITKGFSFVSHGLFQCRLQGLHSPDPNVRICTVLVDERIADFKTSIIGIGQLELLQNVTYFSVIPGFVLPIEAAKDIELIIATQGYEQYNIEKGILSIHHQSRVMFTNFAQDGLLPTIQKGRSNEEVLVRTTRDMVDYTFVKVPAKGMLNNLQMWNFPQIQPAKAKKYNLLEFVHQDKETNNVSLKFGQPTLVKKITNQELEEEFNTPTQSYFNNPEMVENPQPNFHRRSFDKPHNIKRPAVKLLRTNSSSSLGSNPRISFNMMNFEKAENFKEIEEMIKQSNSSKIEAQPSIFLNMYIDGDDEERGETEKTKVVFKTPIYSKPDNSFQKKGKNIFEGKTFMAEKPMNPTGIILNLDNVRDIKKALTHWKKKMHIVFTMHSEWDVDSCHAYAELSFARTVETYMKTLKKGLTQQKRDLLRKAKEKHRGNERCVDSYVYLISREFIGQTTTVSLNKEQEQAIFKLAQLKICNLRYIEEYSNNFKLLFYKCEDDSLKDDYFRKMPIIGEYILQAYQKWKGKNDGIQYLKDDTLGERINFTQDYIAEKIRSDKERKLIEKAFSEVSFKDERDTEIPIQLECP